MRIRAQQIVDSVIGTPKRRLVSGLVVAVAALITIWLALGWVQTGQRALSFQQEANRFEAALKDQDWNAATEQFPELAASAQELGDSTRSLQWRLLSRVPLMGQSAKAVSALGRSADDLAVAGEPLLPYAQKLATERGRRADGSIDLDLIAGMAPFLARFADSVDAAQARLDGVSTAFLVPGLKSRFETARAQATDIGQLVGHSVAAAAWLPSLLGSDSSRTWMVLLQNPAEARGSGGFPGAYVNVRSDNGKVRILESGTSEDVRKNVIPTTGVPTDSKDLWGPQLAKWSMFSRSAHFPLTGALAVADMRARGVPVSGVLAIDPAVVAAMLKAIGPISAKGETITSENAEKFFTQDVYRKYPDSQKRDDVSMALVNAVVAALLTKAWNPLDMAEALKAPLEQGHMRIWSENPKEQAWLSSTSLGGAVPTTPGPVVAVAENNSAPSKMDAFVKTSIDYSVGSCPTAQQQQSKLTVKVRNDAPTGLPQEGGNYGRTDVLGAPEGSTSMVLYIYAPVGAGYLSSTLDGKTYGVYRGHERDREVWYLNLPIDRGQERAVSVTFNEPTVGGVAPRVLTQPMINQPVVQIASDAACN
ncbi:MAG: DUF4012 domain-containing protein [Actinomycetota bacterium]|nr:DUF4012 domain-containing protein [Actinomycetota bacterium]